MSKGRPFFTINDDKGNPISKIFDNNISELSNSGKRKGDSESIDPITGKKYPRGFTPPVDFYQDQSMLDSFKNKSNTGSNNGVNKETGRPIEYGDSITITTKGGIKINGAGDKTKTEFIGGQNPKVNVNLDNLSKDSSYINPDNINPVTNRPVEYGDRIVSLITDSTDTTPSFKLEERYKIYDFYQSQSSKNFIHLLDYFIDAQNNHTIPKINATSLDIGSLKDVYMGSYFTKTFTDNEDPTILGVDIEFKIKDSPIFNGSIDDFISAYGSNYTEISSRQVFLDNFKSHIFKFIKPDVNSLVNAKESKYYFLQSIKGLDNLMPSSKKQFAKYPEDKIDLEFLEDVSQDMGYLSSLYRTLSVSKINGKDIILENLLRFDIDITISEIRNYKRTIIDPKNPKRALVFQDQISKYTYRLYECQFILDQMPHGDSVSNGDITPVKPYNISFNYKFSTMKFIKFNGNVTLNPDGTCKIDYFLINNKRKNLIKYGSSESNKISDNGDLLSPDIISNRIESYPTIPSAVAPVFGLDEIVPSPNDTLGFVGSLKNITPTIEDLKKAEASKLKNTQNQLNPKSIKARLARSINFDQLERGLINAGIRQANRTILVQAALLNRAIDQIRNSVPYAGRINPPNNVYTDTNIFKNDVITEFRKQFGRSLRSFITPP